MSPLERLLVASAVITLGGLSGLVLRQKLTPAGRSPDEASMLRAGLVVVTAPYCTRCTSLQNRLDSAGVAFYRVDAATDSSRLQALGITTAPTLLKVDVEGRVLESETRDFSDERLWELAGHPIAAGEAPLRVGLA